MVQLNKEIVRHSFNKLREFFKYRFNLNFKTLNKIIFYYFFFNNSHKEVFPKPLTIL